MAFIATTRLPTRPLSYEHKDMAYNKELMIDYDAGELYLKDAAGNIHNITDKVADAIIDEIDRDPTMITDSIKVPVTDPDTGEVTDVAIDKVVIEVIKDVTTIQTTINEYQTTTNESITNINTSITETNTKVADNTAKITDNTTKIAAIGDRITVAEGEIDTLEADVANLNAIVDADTGEIKVTPDDIVLDANHRFVTDAQITEIGKIKNKVEINYVTVTVPTSAWSGSSAPYTATINVSGITSSMRPTMDLICSSYYETSEKEEDSYQIYRGVTGSGTVTLYNRVKPTVALTLQFEIKKPTS